MTGYCPRCRSTHPIHSHALGKLGGLLVGGAAGRALGHPLASLVGVVVGSALGHAADRELARRCPGCGDVLEIVADALF